jgi:hypothetical protein
VSFCTSTSIAVSCPLLVPPVPAPFRNVEVRCPLHINKKTGNMAKSVAPRKVIEMMKEATGASDDEVCLMLQLCDGDPNKATEALLSSACCWQASSCCYRLWLCLRPQRETDDASGCPRRSIPAG